MESTIHHVRFEHQRYSTFLSKSAAREPRLAASISKMIYASRAKLKVVHFKLNKIDQGIIRVAMEYNAHLEMKRTTKCEHLVYSLDVTSCEANALT